MDDSAVAPTPSGAGAATTNQPNRRDKRRATCAVVACIAAFLLVSLSLELSAAEADETPIGGAQRAPLPTPVTAALRQEGSAPRGAGGSVGSNEAAVARSLELVSLPPVKPRNATLIARHNSTRRALQRCFGRMGDLAFPPTNGSAVLRGSLRFPMRQVEVEREWMRQRDLANVSRPNSTSWVPGSSDAAGLRDVPFWRFEDDFDPAVDPELAWCRRRLGGFGDRRDVLREVFGVSKSMVQLGDGGTDGNFDVGTDDILWPPLHPHTVRVTESVGAYLGASLSRNSFMASCNLLLGPFKRKGFDPFIPPPLYKWKRAFERSMSYFDSSTNTTHVVRLVWGTSRYITTFSGVLFDHLAPMFNVTNRTHVTSTVHGGDSPMTAPLARVDLAYMLCAGGEWDMEFMDNREIPLMDVDPSNRRNWTAGINYFRKYAPTAVNGLARFVAEQVERGAAPVFWREQPLPGCYAPRYAKPKKKPMRCRRVLRSIVIPAFREITRDGFGESWAGILPVDFIVEPHHAPHQSSAARQPKLKPPPWYRPRGQPPLCLLDTNDGLHLPTDCIWLEMQMTWAAAKAWRLLWAEAAESEAAAVAAATANFTTTTYTKSTATTAADVGDGASAAAFTHRDHESTSGRAVELALSLHEAEPVKTTALYMADSP